MNWLVIIFVALIVFMQIIRHRLISGTTIFVFIYTLYFVIAPLLVGIQDQNVEYASKVGIVSYFVSYLFCYIIHQVNSRQILYQDPLQMELADNEDSALVYSDVIEHNLKWIIVVCIILLITNLGIHGLIDGFRGNLSSRTLMEEHTLGSVYDYIRWWWGLLLVFLFIDNNKHFEKHHIVLIVLYSLITYMFSYTRISLIYVFAMVGIYALLDRKRVEQIWWSSIILAAATIVMLSMGVFRVVGIRDGIQRIRTLNFHTILVDGIDFTHGYMALIDLLRTETRITPLVYFKILFIWIPRSIWAGKPYASSIEILRQIGYASWLSGYSTTYTILGEAYAVMGKMGFVLYPFIFAMITNCIDSLYFNSDNFLNSFQKFFYVYFIVVFLLQCYREGIDIALMNIVLYVVPIYLFSHLDIVIKHEIDI